MKIALWVILSLILLSCSEKNIFDQQLDDKEKIELLKAKYHNEANTEAAWDSLSAYYQRRIPPWGVPDEDVEKVLKRFQKYESNAKKHNQRKHKILIKICEEAVSHEDFVWLRTQPLSPNEVKAVFANPNFRDNQGWTTLKIKKIN